MVEARSLRYSYARGSEVLRGVSLCVHSGEVLAIMGPTGSGKTTLLLILAGLLDPQEGLVRVDGVEPRAARRLVGIVFQNPDDQLFNPTVYDEIAYALRTLGMGEEEIRRRVTRVAEKLGVAHLLDKPPYRLSMGEKRLVALASILVYEPRVLLLDEPFTFLDPVTALRVACIVTSLKREGRAVILTTHNPEVALVLADRVCMLEHGVLECREPNGLENHLATNPVLALLARRGQLREAVESAKKLLLEACQQHHTDNTAAQAPGRAPPSRHPG